MQVTGSPSSGPGDARVHRSHCPERPGSVATVTVGAVLGQLAAGLSIPEFLADFPYLDRADVLAALEFAAAAVQERELPLAQSA